MKNEIIEQIENEVWDRIEAFAEKVKGVLVRDTVEVIKANNKIATGQTYKSIDGLVERLTEKVIVEVFPGVNYAIFEHEDTKPHYPPIWKIREWVRIKGLAQKFVKKRALSNSFKRQTKSIRSYKSMDDFYKVDQIARAIAWKIYHKGTKGLKFFDLALKQAEPRIEQLLTEFKLV